jgi:YebC/PmpR family DNA-binding regulatory protein
LVASSSVYYVFVKAAEGDHGMAGHSKWATIKRKKGKEDAKRGKVFTKLSKEITVSAREGGGDPAGNPRLRLIIEKAKEANMPQENITRAIKKGTGEIAGAAYEAATYEGYGPGGIAVMVETLSDNKNRTVADVRHIFSKMGGSLAENGAVSWMFDRKGVINLVGYGRTEDEVIEKLIEYDLHDVIHQEDTLQITCAPHDLEAIKKAARDVGFTVESAETEWVARDLIKIENAEQEEKAYKFLEALEELDDVQNVYANVG